MTQVKANIWQNTIPYLITESDDSAELKAWLNNVVAGKNIRMPHLSTESDVMAVRNLRLRLTVTDVAAGQKNKSQSDTSSIKRS
jgi:hypothetical protein